MITHNVPIWWLKEVLYVVKSGFMLLKVVLCG